MPRPLGRCRVGVLGQPFTDAVFIEDLGQTVGGVEHVKTLVREARFAHLRSFEDRVIELTQGMLHAGVIDTDHGLINTVVPSSGQPVRLDFEIARCVRFPRLHTTGLGLMLGRLITTFTFAVQPDTVWAAEFAKRATEALHVPRRVLRVAKRFIDRTLEYQRQQIGLDVRLDLPW